MNDVKNGYGKVFNEYKETFLASRNYSQTTRREYLCDIAQLLDFLASKGITQPQSISLNSLNEYLAELDRKKLSGASRRRKVSSIKSLFGFMEQYGFVKNNLAERLLPPRKDTTPPRVLTEAEYQRLQLAVANQPRDAAIIELLLQTGIRLSELASLTVSDIELPQKISQDEGNTGTLIIQRGKGGKGRVLALNYKVCRTLKNWLRVRPQYGDNLFFSKFRKPISAAGYQWLVKGYLDRASIHGAHIHSLRHTFGTHMVRKGTNLRVVQEMMGHSDLKTTSLYVSLARELMNKQMQANAL